MRAFDRAGACPLTGKALVSSNQDLATLRSLQDWYLRYQVSSVPGVAEVASIGGFVKEYQVVLNPQRLLEFQPASEEDIVIGHSSDQTAACPAIRSVIEVSEREYMVRSRGYLRGLADLSKVPVGLQKETGTPIMLGDVASLQIAGAERRGVGEWNGQGKPSAVSLSRDMGPTRIR